MSVSENEIDVDGTSDGYSGTFRWKSSKILPSMPEYNSNNVINYDTTDNAIDVSDDGWMAYFLSRCQGNANEAINLIHKAKSDLSLIDCLSSPISILHAINKIGFLTKLKASMNDNMKIDLHIVILGCSSKAEERVLDQTNCWRELQYYFDSHSINVNVILYFVGPEMSASCHNENKTIFKSNKTAIDFFRSNVQLLSVNTLVVGLNCGFGNWENPISIRYNLLFQWMTDLYFLTATKLPLLFFCANDYADLAGESSLMQKIFGSYFIQLPIENPFSYASTFVDSKTEKINQGDKYSRGNSFWYGVQGHDSSRRIKLNLDDPNKVNIFISTFNSIKSIDLKKILIEIEFNFKFNTKYLENEVELKLETNNQEHNNLEHENNKFSQETFISEQNFKFLKIIIENTTTKNIFISNEGKTLKIQPNTDSDIDSIQINLIEEVDNLSMQAKYNKKSNKLTMIAKCKN